MIVIKVLICGSYKGAFQVKLCQRLKKEKHEVFVLSNDSVEEKKISSVFQEKEGNNSKRLISEKENNKIK